MEVIHPRCAGLDVHKDSVVAAIRLATPGEPKSEVRTFSTTTPGLLALSDWLSGQACTHVAMEAANPAHVKNVPGRKTDVADALWLADLLAHGLIRASFVPEIATQAMRGLLRTRKQLVREQASHIQRVQKVLEEANIKLASILTDIMGLSGRAVLKALIEGETDPDQLVKLIDRRVKASADQRHAALRGRVTDHHRFLLRLHLRHIDTLNEAAGEIDQQVENTLAPFRAAVRLLCSIPGVHTVSAQVIVSEIGTDMSRFPTAGHLISWAGLCPRNDESAGKRRSTRLRKGAPWLKTTLIQCAVSGVKKKGSYLNAQFNRLRQRRGPKKALCAVAASILTAIYHMLRDGTPYHDLGADHVQKNTLHDQARKLAQRIGRLGFNCSLTPKTEEQVVSV